jgi:hypothetical protein
MFFGKKRMTCRVNGKFEFAANSEKHQTTPTKTSKIYEVLAV